MSESSGKNWIIGILVVVIIALIISGSGGEEEYSAPSPSSGSPSSPESARLSTFDEFGFSFKYPSGKPISIYPAVDSSANEDSGMILVGEEEDEEGYLIAWSTITYPRDLDQALDDGLELMEKGLEGTDDWLSPGLRKSFGINGHTGKKQYFGGVVESEKAWGLVAAWNCDVEKKIFIVVVSSNENNIDDLFEIIENYFECH